MTLPEAQQSTKSHELSNQTYWRALYYFNLYRLVLSVALTSIALSGAKIAKLGERNPELFTWACLGFAAMAVFNMITITRGTPAFRNQAYIQFTADAVFITLLAHASGGIGSGLSLLLMVSVAGAGVVLSGRMTVFFAALCTTLAFSEHFVARSLHYVIDGSVTQIGFLGIGLFSTGLILSYASTRIRRTEALAEQRREALADMAMINQMVVARMDTGVIVLNAQGDVELANDTAKTLAGQMREDAALTLASWNPELVAAYQRWLADPTETVITHLLPNGPNVQLRFQSLSSEQLSDTVIFLEDLSASEAQAQQIKLAALGRLTAAVAHEIRNPLGAISHAGQLMGESTKLGREEQRLVEIINKQSERINQIVMSILQLGRPASSQLVNIDLGPWLQDFRQQFLATHDLPPEHLIIDANGVRACTDPDELQQVLRNLCDNAVRYGVKNGESAHITLSAGNLDDTQRAFIDVIDEGPGIEPEQRDKIFEPFYTTDNEGTGLGLYLSRELCQKNHGQLEYLPKENQGACFRVVFATPRHCGQVS